MTLGQLMFHMMRDSAPRVISLRGTSFQRGENLKVRSASAATDEASQNVELGPIQADAMRGDECGVGSSAASLSDARSCAYEKMFGDLPPRRTCAASLATSHVPRPLCAICRVLLDTDCELKAGVDGDVRNVRFVGAASIARRPEARPTSVHRFLFCSRTR